MLKVLAFIVVVFFVSLWASGNDLQSFKDGVDHWADARGEQMSGANGLSVDWGSG